MRFVWSQTLEAFRWNRSKKSDCEQIVFFFKNRIFFRKTKELQFSQSAFFSITFQSSKWSTSTNRTFRCAFKDFLTPFSVTSCSNNLRIFKKKEKKNKTTNNNWKTKSRQKQKKFFRFVYQYTRLKQPKRLDLCRPTKQQKKIEDGKSTKQQWKSIST